MGVDGRGEGDENSPGSSSLVICLGPLCGVSFRICDLNLSTFYHSQDQNRKLPQLAPSCKMAKTWGPRVNVALLYGMSRPFTEGHVEVSQDAALPGWKMVGGAGPPLSSASLCALGPEQVPSLTAVPVALRKSKAAP